MRVTTWNVNSVKARLERLLSFLNRASPDVVLLQELKVTDENFPFEAVGNLGYTATVFGQKTYNGVAILSKAAASDVVRGFGDEDPASRFVGATIEGVRFYSAYIPNGQAVGSDKYAYKLEWLKRMRKFFDDHHAPKDRIVLGGDFNVAPEDRDCHDPAAWRGQILFSEPEKLGLKQVVDFGFQDTFRKFHAEAGHYSWWDYRMLGFPKNRGMRIDFLFASTPLAEKCTKAFIDRDERKGTLPSDHAPVLAEFELSE